jgi:hypothetical protein
VLAWFAGLVGIAALGRYLAGRSRAKTPPAETDPLVEAVPQPEDDPAEELRLKLAETRATRAPVEDESVSERRARVHAEARATIDAMADDGGNT